MRTYRAHFFGKDDKKLHLMIWEPDVKPVAVLQIVHGMTEYIERYKDLAERLTEKGIIVCGFSLRGHGESYNSSKNPKVASIGEDGWEKSIEDINTFLTTGSFPEYVKPAQEGAYVAPQAAAPTYTAPVQAAPVYQAPVTPTPVAQPVYQAPVAPAATPVAQPAAQPAAAPATDRPARNFGGFSF